MKLALDTNRYTDLCRGEHQVVEVVGRATVVAMPLIVLGELQAGFAAGSRGAENLSVLRRFLQKPYVEVLLPSEATAQTYAALYRQLRRQGTPIPTNDLWIAAMVVERSLTLYSRDAHFRHLPQLQLLS
jgi:tRNA(fMet)-specific endonuclease VapC